MAYQKKKHRSHTWASSSQPQAAQMRTSWTWNVLWLNRMGRSWWIIWWTFSFSINILLFDLQLTLIYSIVKPKKWPASIIQRVLKCSDNECYVFMTIATFHLKCPRFSRYDADFSVSFGTSQAAWCMRKGTGLEGGKCVLEFSLLSLAVMMGRWADHLPLLGYMFLSSKMGIIKFHYMDVYVIWKGIMYGQVLWNGKYATVLIVPTIKYKGGGTWQKRHRPLTFQLVFSLINIHSETMRLRNEKDGGCGHVGGRGTVGDEERKI